MCDNVEAQNTAVAKTPETAAAPPRRSPREIIADYERYKYELYKEKYIHGNRSFGQTS